MKVADVNMTTLWSIAGYNTHVTPWMSDGLRIYCFLLVDRTIWIKPNRYYYRIDGWACPIVIDSVQSRTWKRKNWVLFFDRSIEKAKCLFFDTTRDGKIRWKKRCYKIVRDDRGEQEFERRRDER